MAGMSDIYDCSITDNISATDTLVTRMKNVHFQGNIQLNDNRMILMGDDGSADAYIKFAPANLTFFDVTVGATKTLSQLVAAGSPTLDTVFDNGKVINGAVSAATAMQIGGTNDAVRIYENASNDLYIDTTAGANLTIDAAGGTISFSDAVCNTTGHIGILADNGQLRWGAAGATDAYGAFNGTDLVFYDSHLGAEVSLSELAGSNLNSPTIIGDATVSDGKIIQTDTGDEIAYQLTSSGTSVDVHKVIGNSVASGAVYAAHAVDATLAGGGFYYRAYGGAANVFTVGRYGATVIAGNAAGTDALTLTAGDLTITSGDFGVTVGTVTVADTADSTNKISRNNATGTNPVLEVEQTHATGGVGFLVDQNATGDVDAIQVENAGTGYAASTTAGAAGSKGYEYIAAASGTGAAFRGDGTTGSWIGANDVGMIDIDTDGALAAGANLLRVDSTGTNAQNSFVVEILSSGNIAGATDGSVLKIVETGAAAATTYAVNISSTSNEALHVATGKSLFSEQIAITLADNTGPALAVTNPDTTGNSNAVSIIPSGSGAGVAITPQETDTQGILITTIASSTVPLIDIDATTGAGWVGDAATGCIDITADGALVADAALLRIASSGQPAAANDGICIELVESGAAQATSYAMRITSTNNEALHVVSGIVLVDETLTASGGIITQVDVTDVSSPPTDAELDAAIGTPTAGRMVYINDAGGGVNEYLVIGDGTKWSYLAMTACA